MNTTSSTLENNLEKDLTQKINVIIGHILVSKIFLYGYLEEYFINFFKDGQFSLQDYLVSIEYADKVLAGNNFADRYSGFEQNAQEIIISLEKEENLLDSLLESITFHLPYFEGKIDEHGISIGFPHDINFLKNKEGIMAVQNGIKNYISSEINKLKQLIGTPEVENIRSNLIDGLKKLQILS